jgi:1-acyl-sn-glycerol-3-phosphate acyltransferase
MARKNKPFRRARAFLLLRRTLYFFKKKPTIINENEDEMTSPALYLSNHSGAAGPMNLSIFFPYPFIPWGAHQMTGNYRSRWSYSYHIFYRQKLKYSKVRSFILASLLSIISKFLYNNMRLIGTYQDLRTTKTIRASVDYILKGESILIFPEESRDGYDDIIEKFNPGFVVLADHLYRSHQLSVPLYPVYYSKKRRFISIGKKIDYAALADKGLSKMEIADYIRREVNALSHQLMPKKKPHK